MTTNQPGPVDGAALKVGDTFADEPTGPHTIIKFDKYPGRFISGTPGEQARVARCDDGTTHVVRDHGHYLRVVPATVP